MQLITTSICSVNLREVGQPKREKEATRGALGVGLKYWTSRGELKDDGEVRLLTEILR